MPAKKSNSPQGNLGSPKLNGVSTQPSTGAQSPEVSLPLRSLKHHTSTGQDSMDGNLPMAPRCRAGCRLVAVSISLV